MLAIPGTGDPGHLAANVAAAALRFGPGELARLSAWPATPATPAIPATPVSPGAGGISPS